MTCLRELVWSSEVNQPIHLGEPVRTHNAFIYKGVYYLEEPIEGTVSFFVRSGSESISLMYLFLKFKTA